MKITRRLYLCLLVALTMNSCSKDDEQVLVEEEPVVMIPDEEPGNENPSMVTITSEVIKNEVVIEWTTATDPENSELTYTISLDGVTISENQSDRTYTLSDLEFNQVYTGTIVVKDTSDGISTTNFTFETDILNTAIGSELDENSKGAIQTADDGVLIFGDIPNNNFFGNFLGGDNDATVIKLDKFGNVEWKKNYGGSDTDYFNGGFKTQDNYYVLVGFTNSSDNDLSTNNGDDAWAIKIDGNGNVIWSKNYGGTGYDVFQRGVEAADSNYVFGGSSSSSDGDTEGNIGLTDVFVVKVNPNTGALIWKKTIGGTLQEQVGGIVANEDGSLVFALYSKSGNFDFGLGNYGDYDSWVIKLDATGDTILWKKRYGGSGSDISNGIVKSSSNGYLISGITNSTDVDIDTNKGSQDGWVYKIDLEGDLIWSKTYGTSGSDGLNTIVTTNDGDYYLGGYHDNNVDGDVTEVFGIRDAWLVKIDDNGAVKDQKTFGGSKSDDFTGLAITSTNKVYAIGNLRSSEIENYNGAVDIYVVKY
ncbi:hypothetical protein ABW636_00575 [Aquimarina sp. 2201CG1-2-11]|uniref:hypothetical protein n=1 Tax=Aquimarina discodermiae TaxID=3231043 RepID=UPI003462B43B